MPLNLDKPIFFNSETKWKPYNDIISGSSPGNPGIGSSGLGYNPVDKYRGLSFFCGILDRNNDCCFNHVIGLPEKDGKAFPLHDYEIDILNLLEGIGIDAVEKYIWIKKATGLGISEFSLRYIAWKCMCSDIWKNKKVCLVTGPRLQLAIDLIDRIKGLFKDMKFDTKNTVVELNDCHIEAYPSYHLDDMRGLTNVKFILLDEADFFPPSEQEQARDVSERYIAKSDPYIVMISTPNEPGGLFDKMENDKTPDFLYRRLFLPYTVGLNKIYTEQDIITAKRSPSFKREYELSYGYGLGNIISEAKINACLCDYEEYPNWILEGTSVAMGVDPAFGSSTAAYVIVAQIGDKIIVIDCGSFERDSPSRFVDLLFNKYRKYHAMKIFVDPGGSGSGVITDLKGYIREETDVDAVKARATHDKVDWMQRMIVVPLAFGKYGDQMLSTLISLVEDGKLLIPRKFEDLILDMRIAKEKNGKFDKTTNTMDLFDALRLATYMYSPES